MVIKRRTRIIAWLLSICLVVTLIPDFGYAATAENAKSMKTESTDEKKEEVTEEDVIEKSENITTYAIGDEEKMAVFHGDDVRFKDKSGKLVDYDPSLVPIKDKESAEKNKSLDGYKYKNKTGDKKHFIPEVLSKDTPVFTENGEYKISLTPTDKTIEEVNLKDTSARLERCKR